MRTPLTGRPCATILMYHSISEPCTRSFVVSPSTFESQMAHLASRARVIPLEEYVVARLEDAPLERSSIIITFDDGYRDNFTNAFPVLMKYGLPATFFVSTDYIGTGRVKWEDRLNAMVRQSRAATISVEAEALGERLQFDLTDESRRGKAVNRLARTLSGLHYDARQQTLKQLERQLGKATDIPTGEELMLSWDEIREMAAVPGMVRRHYLYPRAMGVRLPGTGARHRPPIDSRLGTGPEPGRGEGHPKFAAHRQSTQSSAPRERQR